MKASPTCAASLNEVDTVHLKKIGEKMTKIPLQLKGERSYQVYLYGVHSVWTSYFTLRYLYAT